MLEWTVRTEETGLTLLDLLRRRLPAAPVSYLRQQLRRGRVRCNGELRDETATVSRGDRLGLAESRRLQEWIEATGSGLAILCETREALVLDKPAGLAVHPAVGHQDDNLLHRVQALLRNRRLALQCAPVHRLDLETSGPVLFAKGRRALSAFGRVFMEEPVTKIYLALVAGVLPETGQLETPVPVRGRMKEAATRFFRCAAGQGLSLLELHLLSGRRHQIRRQLADAGHPLVGDRRYGGPDIPGLDRLFLHCRYLELTDPFGPDRLVARSPLPPELRAELAAQGLFWNEGATTRDLAPPDHGSS
jgi:RluA family pseudouridine synthase